MKGALASSMVMISNQRKLSGSTLTVFGGETTATSSSSYDDGDSGILVYDSGQSSMLSDGHSVVLQPPCRGYQEDDEPEEQLKTVYLRRTSDRVGKNFGLLISQIARTFETDHNRFRIRHVLKNSEADVSGELQVGDEIISVNDVPAIELSFDQMQEVINSKSVLRLVVQRSRRRMMGHGGSFKDSARDIRWVQKKPSLLTSVNPSCHLPSSSGSTLTLTMPLMDSIMHRYLTQQTLSHDETGVSSSSDYRW